MASRSIKLTRERKGSESAEMFLNCFSRVTVSEPLTLVTTGDADTDIGTIDLTHGDPDSVNKLILEKVWVEVVTAGGTVAASVLDIRTAAAGGGSSLVTPGAMTGLTAVGKIKTITVPTQTDVVSADTLYVRQTTDSANPGTIRVYCSWIDASAYA